MEVNAEDVMAKICKNNMYVTRMKAGSSILITHIWYYEQYVTTKLVN